MYTAFQHVVVLYDEAGEAIGEMSESPDGHYRVTAHGHTVYEGAFRNVATAVSRACVDPDYRGALSAALNAPKV